MFTLKQIADLQAAGEISMTEAVKLRIEARQALETGKTTKQPAKQQQKKQPAAADEEADIEAPPKKKPAAKQPAKQAKPAAKQQQQKKQPAAEAARSEVIKLDIPGAEDIEYCPTAVIYLGPGKYEGTHCFKIGREYAVRSVDVWNHLADELYSERVGAFIRDMIAE
jgi:hypothetical protein